MKLEELRALLEKATPRPWRHDSQGGSSFLRGLPEDTKTSSGAFAEIWSNMKDTDTDLIVALRNAAPALLACAATLQAIDAKIGHFAASPSHPDMPMLSIIGDAAREIKAAIKALEDV